MSVRRKIAFGLAGAAGLVLALAAAFFFLAPLYLNMPAVKARIETGLSRAVGGAAAYEKLGFSLVPRPRVVVLRPKLSLPETASGTAKSLSISPQLLPLLEGRLLLSAVRIEEPDITVVLPAAAAQAVSAPPSVEEVRAGIKPALAFLKELGPGFLFQADDGRIVLTRQGRSILALRGVQAGFTAPPGEMEFSMAARSDAWGPVALSGSLRIDEHEAAVRSLAGTFGSSSFSGLSASLSFAKPHMFLVSSGTAELSLDELFPWLSASENAAALLRDLQGLKGPVRLTSLSFGGPLESPSSWRVKITGESTGVVAETRLLPAPLFLAGRFSVENGGIEGRGVSAALGKSSASGVSGRYLWKGRPRVDIFSGRAAVSLDQAYEWRSFFGGLKAALKGVKRLSGRAVLSDVRFGGPLDRPASWRLAAAGGVQKLVFDAAPMPGPASVAAGRFDLDQEHLSFSDVQGSILDSSLTLSGSIQGLRSVEAADLDVSGTIGPKSRDWTFSTFSLPPALVVRAPLTLSLVHVAWKRPSGVAVAGQAAVSQGPVVTADLSHSPGEFILRKGTITDSRSAASFSYRQEASGVELSFSGTLAQSTLKNIFSSPAFGSGTVEGKFRATVPAGGGTGRPALEGSLRGEDLVIPWGVAVPLKLDRLSLRARGNVLTIDSVEATWGPSHFSLTGDVTASPGGYVLDLALGSSGFSVEDIEKELGKPAEKRKKGKGPRFPVSGVVQVKTAALAYGRYTFSPLEAVVTLGPGGTNAAVTAARVCGVSVSGSLAFRRTGVAITLASQAAGLPLEQSAACLAGTTVSMSGTFDLNAAVNLEGKSGAFLPSLEGKVDFKSRDGKIYRYPALAKIFSVLSVTEIFRGKLPELGGNGFPYHTMTVKGAFHHGRLAIDEAYIDGSSVDLIAQGDVDLPANKLDLVVLVSPFSTVNWIIRHIPLVGKLLGGTLISVPVKVSGSLEDPDVTVLAPSAVGTRIIELLKNIVELPVELISPLLPKEKKEEGK